MGNHVDSSRDIEFGEAGIYDLTAEDEFCLSGDTNLDQFQEEDILEDASEDTWEAQVIEEAIAATEDLPPQSFEIPRNLDISAFLDEVFLPQCLNGFDAPAERIVVEGLTPSDEGAVDLLLSEEFEVGPAGNQRF